MSEFSLEETVKKYEGWAWFEVWVEGYMATCEHGFAKKVGKVYAESFVAACLQLWTPDWGELSYDSTGRPTFWNCRLYETEAEARVSYG